MSIDKETQAKLEQGTQEFITACMRRNWSIAEMIKRHIEEVLDDEFDQFIEEVY